MLADDDAPVPADEYAPLLAGGNGAIEEREKGAGSLRREILHYTGAVAFVVAAGVIAWAVSTQVETGDDVPPTKGDEEIIEWRSQVMGWISAVLYRTHAYSRPARPASLTDTSLPRCSGLAGPADT